MLAKDAIDAGRLRRSRNSGRNSICSTMAFSTAHWPAISISCCSLPKMLAIACSPPGRLREPLTALASGRRGCADQRRVPDAFPLEEKLVWRARRGIVPSKFPPAGRLLRHRTAQEFRRSQLRTARTSNRLLKPSIATTTPTARRTFATCLDSADSEAKRTDL